MWHAFTKEERCKHLEDVIADLRAEIDVLQQQALPETSIWRMKKEQLVEVAIEELSITRAQATKSNMDTLKQRIKQSRDMLKTHADPLACLPKGFSMMSYAELVREMTKRNLPMPEGMNGPHRACTRGFMKVKIEDDVEQRVILLGRQAPQTQADLRETRGTSSTSGIANTETEWMTINTPRGQAMDTEVPRATSRRRSS